MSTGEDLNMDYVIYGLVGTLYFSIDWIEITSSGIKNNFMVNEELHEVLWSWKLSTFTNPEDGSRVAMVTGELYEWHDELEWWKLWSDGIYKEVAGVSTNNGEVWGNFLAVDLFEEAEVKMKVSTWI